MADMNYVSPLTSDLTDYYTKSEVDELQQGDAATYATSAEIVAGDNAVKGWVVSQGFLTEHQDLTNYATISYVDDAIAAIEPSSGGMAVRVVNTLPLVGEENVLYLVFVDNEDEDNRYAEYIWVDTLNDYEMLGYGSSDGGIIPDLTDYATKQWVEAKGYLDSSDLIGYATVNDLADFATKDYVDDELANKADNSDLAAVATSGDYDDLINKPTIPSLTGYATEAYVNNAVAAIDAKHVSYDNQYSGLEADTVKNAIDEVNAKVEAIDIPAAPDLTPYATKAELSAKANTADLASVATTGSYNDLTNKPAIPTVPANVSAFTNDAGYLTAHQDISGKANTADLATVAFSGDYDDLTNKPSIPSTSGLASESYVDAAVAAIDIPTVPTNVSSFTNDAGYLTSHQDISGKVDGIVVSGTTTAKIFNEVDGGGAQIITASARGFAGVHDGSNPDATYATMYVKNAAGTSTLARVDLDGDGKAYYLKNGASKAAGSEIAVKSDIPDVSDFITANDLPDLTGYVESSDLAVVATSGSYTDLSDKPTIPDVSGLATESYVDNAIDAATGDLATLEDIEGLAVAADLATVATSGSYNDLTDKPTIPAAPDLTPYATKQELAAKADTASLASVATSGDYSDLINKPEIDGFDELIRTVFFLNSSFNTGLAERTAQTKDELIGFYNKGYIVNFTSDLLPLTLTLSDLGCQEQQISITEIKSINNSFGISNTASSSGVELQAGSYLLKISNNGLYVFIPKSGQTVVDLFRLAFKGRLYFYNNTNSGLTANRFQDAIDELAASIPTMPTLATVATSGDYDDLINKPTLFSGDYNDLRNKPTIPSGGGGSVGWSYDSRTGYMTFTGMSDDNL